MINPDPFDLTFESLYVEGTNIPINTYLLTVVTGPFKVLYISKRLGDNCSII